MLGTKSNQQIRPTNKTITPECQVLLLFLLQDRIFIICFCLYFFSIKQSLNLKIYNNITFFIYVIKLFYNPINVGIMSIGVFFYMKTDYIIIFTLLFMRKFGLVYVPFEISPNIRNGLRSYSEVPLYLPDILF